MKILWIPQLPLSSLNWEGSRHYHLLRYLSCKHEVHVVSWRHAKKAAEVIRLGRYSTNVQAPLIEHSVFLAPSIYRLISNTYPRNQYLWLNHTLFGRCVAAIAQDFKPDICVYSSSHHATGFPPILRQPMVFDYLDLSPESVEQFYIQSATAVVGASARLTQAGLRWRKPTYLIPNGIDVDQYTDTDRNSAKQKLGLNGHTVVSLIGLTCSSSLYFVDAVAALQKERPDVMLLAVGSGPLLKPLIQRAAALKIANFWAPGLVPNSEVHDYFAATDVGLYPGDDIPYFRQASPLKIVEYTGAGAQVVSSPVEAFQTGWPNVRIAHADSASFQKAILEAVDAPRPIPDVTLYDWRVLAERFEKVFEGIAR